LDRGRTAIGREEGGVKVDAALARDLEDLFGKEPEGDHYEELRRP
jgi:hypothetical protein